MQDIRTVGRNLGLDGEKIKTLGPFMAKLPLSSFLGKPRSGKLVLVSAMNPTPAGEGKTTVTVGLGDALAKLGLRSGIALREPSIGPVMGLKGGGTGGGRSTIVPEDEINLHFTNDFAAVAAAHNLLAAVADNALHHRQADDKNALSRVILGRVIDQNDRALRSITLGRGKAANGVERESGFDIVAASEVMAILCLARDLSDLKARLGRIIVGYTDQERPVTAKDLQVEGAMTALLKHAIEPNLVQSGEGTPAFVHGGPFANIAHGTNSLLATWAGLSLCDVLVTEAGFGFDLGGEKYLDLVSPLGNLKPGVVVLVATVRSLKMHGGVPVTALKEPDPESVTAGLANLTHHLESLSKFGLPAVVAINRFADDTDEELAVVTQACAEQGYPSAICRSFERGGEGNLELAKLVQERLLAEPKEHKLLYDVESAPQDKIKTIAREIYGARDVIFEPKALEDLKQAESLGLSKLPICMAKTQKSLSDKAKLLGRPKDFDVTVRSVRIAAGAGFLIPMTGSILTMPGLPADPAARRINISDKGEITGIH